MKRQAINDKVIVLGIDGMDPRLTKKYLDQGLLPNVAKLLEQGSAREDLMLLGAVPTVTPPMWTTLATGAYPMTHGITAFYRAVPELDTVGYNLDSKYCKAEQLWNVTAEAGKKTLVWMWPGAAWPPSSDSENLMVVDGSTPGTVNMGVAQVEADMMLTASVDIKAATTLSWASRKGVLSEEEIAELTAKGEKEEVNANTACVITNAEIAEDGIDIGASVRMAEMRSLITEVHPCQLENYGMPIAVGVSPIVEAQGWQNIPADAKEFILLTSKGKVRRPSLILKNEDGIYDRVAIYKNKKAAEPMTVLYKDVMVSSFIDEAYKGDKKIICNRNLKLLELAEDGTSLKLYLSASMDTTQDSLFYPKDVFQKITQNVGFPPPCTSVGGQDRDLINRCMLDSWTVVADWQADSLNYMIEKEGVEVIFSHYHNIDIQSHMFIRFMTDTGYNEMPPEVYQDFMVDVYQQTDYYVGKFLHLLDKGWDILLVSDHGLVCSEYRPPMLGDMMCNVRLMEDLGYTVRKCDADGNKLDEIDWEKTKAIATRETHIYLNIKGRDPHGIVDPADKYALEEEIIDALYGYRDQNGKRVVAAVLRNRDALLLGQGGPDCGDLIYWTAEGHNYDHADSLSTTYGMADTSVSPIFIAAGKGIKSGYTTTRYIREVDVAPTVAAILGVRMPHECEGAPAYQIFSEEY